MLLNNGLSGTPAPTIRLFCADYFVGDGVLDVPEQVFDSLRCTYVYGFHTKKGRINRPFIIPIGYAYLCSQMSLIAVLSSPSIVILAKAGTQMRSTPIGAR